MNEPAPDGPPLPVLPPPSRAPVFLGYLGTGLLEYLGTALVLLLLIL